MYFSRFFFFVLGLLLVIANLSQAAKPIDTLNNKREWKDREEAVSVQRRKTTE
jgi:hypothetical protein